MKTREPLVVEVSRNSVVESTHEIRAAIADQDGRILEVYGDQAAPVFPRSSIKALQALDLMQSGAISKFRLDDRMIALASSSHRGEAVHLKVLHEWLKILNHDENILECGHAWPVEEKAKEEMIRAGKQPARICHNCSGKHLGLISSCEARGENPKDYRTWKHPVQKRLRQSLGELMRINFETLKYGTDGCGIPTYAIPIQNLALGAAAFLKASGDKQGNEGQIFRAMKAHPDLVSGSGDFVTLVMQKTQGRALVKSGAEGAYLGWIPEKGVAFALKSQDGSGRAVAVAMGWLLKHWGGIAGQDEVNLKDVLEPEITNSREEVVGAIRLRPPG